jgi:hypothetical protein
MFAGLNDAIGPRGFFAYRKSQDLFRMEYSCLKL